jgi:two-component system response regulator AtoC
MMTAYATVKTAVEAMKRGAFDFITKPIEREELLAAVERAMRESDAAAGTSGLYFELPRDVRVAFRDPKSLALAGELRRAAGVALPVLLTGETGVGKEVFARLLHELGPRKEAPFVKVNCATLPEALFESELFGHEKGAFSGAIVAKPGRVEIAEGGTLFLDEIGELTKPLQAKMLQFLQDRTFERVGGVRTLRADVRLVAATHRDLKEALREDLYFRLSGVTLHIPPLRERPGDIDSLAAFFLERSGANVSLAAGTLEALRAYEWPGNVRELEQRLERAIAFATGPALTAADILPAPSSRASGSLRDERTEFERKKVVGALRETKGNRTEAARKLRISRRMLQKKLKSLGIDDE